jgi:hypothetical protein
VPKGSLPCNSGKAIMKEKVLTGLSLYMNDWYRVMI